MNKEYDLFLPWVGSKHQRIFSRIKPDIFFRLNPHWLIHSFSLKGDTYLLESADHETGQKMAISGKLIDMQGSRPQISAQDNEWQSITFFEKDGSLHADVHYSEEPSETIEQHIVLWLRSIKEYLRLYTRSTLNTRFFRFIMNRMILQMNPSQRKISLMLIRITMLEILVIIIIVVGWFFFLR